MTHITASSCVSCVPIDFSARPGCGPFRLQIEWRYGIGTANGSKTSFRGQNEQMTKFRP